MNIDIESTNQKQRFEKKVKEIILDDDRCDIQNNFYSPHLIITKSCIFVRVSKK